MKNIENMKEKLVKLLENCIDNPIFYSNESEQIKINEYEYTLKYYNFLNFYKYDNKYQTLRNKIESKLIENKIKVKDFEINFDSSPNMYIGYYKVKETVTPCSEVFDEIINKWSTWKYRMIQKSTGKKITINYNVHDCEYQYKIIFGSIECILTKEEVDYYLEKIIKNREKFYELEKQKKIENDDKILEDRMKRYSI